MLFFPWAPDRPVAAPLDLMLAGRVPGLSRLPAENRRQGDGPPTVAALLKPTRRRMTVKTTGGTTIEVAGTETGTETETNVAADEAELLFLFSVVVSGFPVFLL